MHVLRMGTRGILADRILTLLHRTIIEHRWTGTLTSKLGGFQHLQRPYGLSGARTLEKYRFPFITSFGMCQNHLGSIVGLALGVRSTMLMIASRWW